ncbi:MAG: class I SAM-dependent methyltransferase [Chloroflexota bacterium]
MATLIPPFLRWFFRHLYTDLAWSYNIVAWLVSLGRWGEWQQACFERLPQGDVLELGHGPGHVLLSLAQSRAQAVGLDPSPQMGNIARRRLRRHGCLARLVRGRAQALPFQAASFDGVVATFPAEYVFEPGVAHEVWRVLHSGGRLVIIPVAIFLPTSLIHRVTAWLFRVTGQAEEAGPDWTTPFLQAGFSVEVERLEQRGSVVIRLVASKPAA